MENPSAKTKTLSDSILELTKSVTPDAPILGETTTTTSSTTSSGFLGLSLLSWLVIILILAFLGFNIFAYLAKGTDIISNFLAPLLQAVFGTTFGLASETIDVAAEGGKAVVSGTATGVNAGLTGLQDITPNKASGSVSSKALDDDEDEEVKEAKNSLKNALNSKKKRSEDEGEYEPHEASSSVNTSKAGWCFIGEDRGNRTCSKVGENDKCMSGDIFPSQELCINPNLRA